MKTQTLEDAKQCLRDFARFLGIDNLSEMGEKAVTFHAEKVWKAAYQTGLAKGQQQKAEEIIEQITWITPKTHLNCTLQSKLPYAKNVCSCGAREFNNGIQKVLERVKELSPAPLSVEKEI